MAKLPGEIEFEPAYGTTGPAQGVLLIMQYVTRLRNTGSDTIET